jgi:hypothetical protein
MNWQQKTGGPEAPPSRPPGKVRTHQGSDHCHANTIREAKGTANWSLQARTPGTVEQTPPPEGFVTKQPAIRSHPSTTRTLCPFAPFCPCKREAFPLLHVHDSVITDWTDQDPPLSVIRRNASPAICTGQSAINTHSRNGRSAYLTIHASRHGTDIPRSRTDSWKIIYRTCIRPECGSKYGQELFMQSTSTANVD